MDLKQIEGYFVVSKKSISFKLTSNCSSLPSLECISIKNSIEASSSSSSFTLIVPLNLLIEFAK